MQSGDRARFKRSGESLRGGRVARILRRGGRWALGLAAVAVLGAAQALSSYPIQYYSAKSGLAGGVVRGIERTADGVMWFACWGRGVTSYDGFTWKSHTPAEGLPSVDIRMVRLDDSGRLWAGGIGGLVVWTGARWEPVPVDLPDLTAPSVYSILPRRNGDIWFGLSDGEVIAFHPDENASPQAVPSGRWTQVLSNERSRTRMGVAGLHERPDGTVVCGLDEVGVLRWNGSTWFQETGDDLVRGMVSFCEAEGGGILAGGRSGLWRHTPGAMPAWESIATESVKAVARQGEARYAVAFTNRLEYFRGADRQVVTLLEDHTQFPTQILRYFPETGETWVGTKLGVFRIGGRGWAMFAESADGFWPRSTALYADSEIPATMSNADGRIFQFDGDTWSAVGAIEAGTYESIRRGRGGSLWFVREGRAIRWDLRQRAAGESLELPAGARNLIESDSGILLAWGPVVMAQRVGDGWRDTPAAPSPGVEGLHDVLLTSRDELIVSKVVSLSRWAVRPDGTMSLLHQIENGQNFRGLLEEADGTILAGVNEDGIYRFRDGNLDLLATFERDPSARVSCLFRRGNGTLYSGSLDLGISAWRDGRWQWHGNLNGFPAGAIQAIYEDPQGTLWAEMKGVGVLRHLADVEAPDTSIVQMPSQVPHGERTVIRIAGVDRWNESAAEHLVYSARFRPLDEAEDGATPWHTYAGETSIISPRLPHGEYTFEVRASDADFNVDPTPARMVFTVLPPLWAMPSVMVPIVLLGLATITAALMLWRSNATLRLSEKRLRESRDRAEAASQAKSRLLAQVSHEFRTPMNAIIGHAQLLQNRPAGPAAIDESVEIILRSGDHVIEIVNNLLEAARGESGTIQLNPVVFAWRELVDGLIKMLSTEYDPARLAVRHLSDGSVPEYLRADESKLRQVLLSLLGNAVKFCPEGSVAVRAQAKPPLAPGDKMILSVVIEDTGVGIEPDALERIFEPFEQGAAGRQAGGAGLGLSIAHRLITAMGGTINVASEPGQGTTIFLTVPVEEAEGAPQSLADTPAAQTQSLPGRRILVVDDIELNLTVMEKLLAPAGFEVRGVPSGEAALALVESWAPDLILMDRAMPGMDGIEATRRIRATEQGRAIPIIFVTGGVLDEELESVLEPGCTDIMLKPFRQSELMGKIRKFLHDEEA